MDKMGPGWKHTGRVALLLLLALASVASGQSADSCSSSFTFTQNRTFTSCVTLSELSCFLHWTYNASTGTADIAFRATQITSSNWVAWALNPTYSGSGNPMDNAQALVAYKHSNGSTWAYTSSIAGTGTTLAESNLSFTVTELSTESSSDDAQIIIFAKVQLPNNATSLTHLWQVGPLSSGSPSQHDLTPAHESSTGTINFLSGDVVSGGGAASRERKRSIHGVLNAVSWGTLMPIGFVIARYMKVFESANPAWFYMHVTCQCTAYVLGVAGWGLGLKLSSESGLTYHSHRVIGILIFTLATLQVCALLWRPSKDHKRRWWWNIFHHGMGYTIIIFSIINVFKGISILRGLHPEGMKKWKTVYIVVIVALGSIALVLEVITWIIVLNRKKRARLQPKTNAYSGEPTNGYAFTNRPQPYA